MKRYFVALVLLFTSIAVLTAAPIEYIWSWKSNDPEVKYFRYHTDAEEEWKVVDTTSFRSHFFFDKIEPHTFYIQQSYDGENWSETKEKSYAPIYEKEQDVIDEKYNKQSLSLLLTPYQSYVEKNAPNGAPDFMSSYSFGAELNATQYYGQYFGLMVSGVLNRAYRDVSFDSSATYYDIFAGVSFRLIANRKIDFSLKAGVGPQFEEFNGEWTISPAAYASVNSSIRINKNFYVVVSPAVIYVNPGLFDQTNQFNNMTFRELSIGIELQQ